MSRPIRPNEVVKRRESTIPDAVFDSFNELIFKHWNGSSATVKQNVVVAMIASALQIDRQEVFDNHYLDIEPHYTKAGWDVKYDKPAYNETYEATFEFRKRKK